MSLVRSRARLYPMVSALLSAVLLSTPLRTSHAQSGTLTFGGSGNAAVPNTSYSGPALTFSSVIRSGFGNTSVVAGSDALWWTGGFSGQGMLYGNNSTLGNVLEVTLDAGAGFNLFLGGALFGGWANAQRYVTYRLFNDDYSQSSAAVTVQTGTATPAAATFTSGDWGSVVRLQFTETNVSGANIGRGVYDVGVQDIEYTVTRNDPIDPVPVPEPSPFVLVASGIAGLAMTARRRRHQASE